MTREEYAEYLMYWRRGNDNGDGFPVGNDDEDNIFEAIIQDGHTIEAAFPYQAAAAESTAHRSFLAVASRSDGSLYVVCDSHGAWGVNL